MSRRTKLIIAALFLVLLGIAITGAVYYWQPENPLRISIAANQEPARAIADRVTPASTPFYVTVENAGHTPVLLHGATLDEIPTAITRRNYMMAVIDPVWQFFSDPAVDGTHWLIPPHSSIRCTVIPTEEDCLAIALRGRMEVTYSWSTPSSHRYSQFRKWLRELAPRPLQEFLREPESFRDSTLLAVPPVQQVR